MEWCSGRTVGNVTLLRILAGLELPDTGIVSPGHGLRIGYHAQEHETLDLDRTVLENMRAAAPESSDGELRKILGAFLFSGDAADQPAGTERRLATVRSDRPSIKDWLGFASDIDTLIALVAATTPCPPASAEAVRKPLLSQQRSRR